MCLPAWMYMTSSMTPARAGSTNPWQRAMSSSPASREYREIILPGHVYRLREAMCERNNGQIRCWNGRRGFRFLPRIESHSVGSQWRRPARLRAQFSPGEHPSCTRGRSGVHRSGTRPVASKFWPTDCLSSTYCARMGPRQEMNRVSPVMAAPL